MKRSDYSKPSPTHASAPVQRSTPLQQGTIFNAMPQAYSNPSLQLQRMLGNQAAVQLFSHNEAMSEVAQRAAKDNDTGLPNELKSGLESLSGYDLSDVKVHYNSDKPEKLQAHAYAQGSDIHVGPGQEKHLPHEGWHIVQQKQGRVRSTTQLKGAAINNDASLEKEADVMGAKAYEGGSNANKANEPRTLRVGVATALMQGAAAIGGERDAPLQRNTSSVLDKAVQRLSRYDTNENLAVATTKNVIQRALTLDNADFSAVTSITKLGGNAEGAYLVDDGTSKVVVKVASSIDSTVMAYNLAKDFQVNIPSARYLELATGAGETLIDKAEALNSELKEKLNKASAVTLSEYIPGNVLGHFKGKNIEDDQVRRCRAKLENFVMLGRMLVYDAAILNGDRFKIEFGSEANSGNLMIANEQPVGLDQDFAHVDDYNTPGETLGLEAGEYGRMFADKLKPLLSNPEKLAQTLVDKMVQEQYFLFEGMNDPITDGINQGIEILRGLTKEDEDKDKDDSRLKKLIEWTKTFKSDTDLDIDSIRKYWSSLIG